MTSLTIENESRVQRKGSIRQRLDGTAQWISIPCFRIYAGTTAIATYETEEDAINRIKELNWQ